MHRWSRTRTSGHRCAGSGQPNVWFGPIRGGGVTRDRAAVGGQDHASATGDELVPQTGLAAPGLTVSDLLDTAPTRRFTIAPFSSRRMGFFPDAYDLFVIAIVATLTKTQWQLSTTETSWVTGSAILAAFFGALVFGRLVDVLGRKAVYTVVAAIMVVGTLRLGWHRRFPLLGSGPVRSAVVDVLVLHVRDLDLDPDRDLRRHLP